MFTADNWYHITGETCVQEFGGICRRLALPGGKGVLYILFKKVIHVGEVQLLEANSTYLNPRFLI